MAKKSRMVLFLTIPFCISDTEAITQRLSRTESIIISIHIISHRVLQVYKIIFKFTNCLKCVVSAISYRNKIVLFVLIFNTYICKFPVIKASFDDSVLIKQLTRKFYCHFFHQTNPLRFLSYRVPSHQCYLHVRIREL